MHRSLAFPTVVATAIAVLTLPAAPAHAAAPPPVTGLAATPGDAQVRLSWTNPASAEFAGVVVRMATGHAAPADPHAGQGVYSGTATTTTVTGLTNGTTYSFSVFAHDGSGNHSAPATVQAVPVPAAGTSLTITRSAGWVYFRRWMRLGGTLRRTDTGAGVGGERVEILERRFGSDTWRAVKSVVTAADGSWWWTPTMTVGAWFQARHAATPYFGQSATPATTVHVRQVMALQQSTAALELGNTAVFSATVRPAHPGGYVRLQQHYAGAWRSVQIRRLSAYGTVAFPVRPGVLGTYYFRIARDGDVDHLRVIGGPMRLTVVHRTLRQGMTGRDVYDVERRLLSMRYDVGVVDGVFDYDMTHAVAAFQKVNGLRRTSVVDQSTWSRLLRGAVLPRLRYTRAGTWVEADLTRQVLYVGRDGRLFRVVDISSGSGQYYTVDGRTYRAVTPTGAFRVERKINGWRTSRLGELYRPAYFYAGYAIHGSYSVPTYPASHGCIRVTIAAMDRLYGLLGIGVPVWVYYG